MKYSYMPTEIISSPGFNNRNALRDNVLCGCYYCLKQYPIDSIKEWVDTNTTAVCPECSIDAVVPLEVGISEKEQTAFLERLYKKYFSRSFC